MEKEFDIYDFDHTIVPFDSGTRFVIYCFVHYPWCLITLPVVAIGGMLTAIGAISFTKFKQICFSFVPLVPLKKAVKGFWDKYAPKAYSWWKDEKPRDFIVISASPDFMLNDVKARLGIENLICTRHNAKTGAIIGENCRDEEKVRRLNEEFPGAKIVDVYSDSYTHDRPIFSIATGKTVHIEKGKRVEFNYNEVYGEK
jgi:hypothetical protein